MEDRVDPRMDPSSPPDEALRSGAPPVVPLTPAPQTPASPGPGQEGAEEPQSLRELVEANAFSSVVVAAVLVLIFLYFDLESIWAICKAALGLSFVIFIHELGHFAVAKWCDVHVTAFSIGFGPPIPGCWFRWGETTYKLCVFPLGGYVQMVGQVDGDESSDGSEDDPRSYRAKSVGARMAIISAGVIMNVILAVVIFIVVYLGPGKARDAAVVRMVDTNSPAFRAGLRTGATITQVGDIHDPTFDALKIRVMQSLHAEKLKVVSSRPGEAALETEIEPRLDESDTSPIIGIAIGPKLQMVPKKIAPPGATVPAWPLTAAARAEPPFEFNDMILGTSVDPNDLRKIEPLPEDPRKAGQKDYFTFARRMQTLADKEVWIRVQREEGTLDIKVPPAYRSSLGVCMEMGQVLSLRDHSEAAEKLRARDTKASRQGDVIQAVRVTEADGTVTEYANERLDSEKLPLQLKQWSARLDAAGYDGDRKVQLTLRRHRDDPGEQYETVNVDLLWQTDWTFDETYAGANSPLAIPELGLAYLVKTTVADVTDPASSLKAGDVIKWIRFDRQDYRGEEITGKKNELQPEQWAMIASNVLSDPRPISKVYLGIQRVQEDLTVEFKPGEDRTWPLNDRGWMLSRDTRIQKANDIVEAITFGLRDTHNNMLQVFLNLRGMFLRRLSPTNLVGPLRIAEAAYRIAGLDLWEFVFFLGLISVNLAVVNFLPIPVLDGGHMVFLLYEKLRGQPASEGVRNVATLVGLAMIGCLMIFVFYLDLTRLFL